jgi:hypothetical protein
MRNKFGNRNHAVLKNISQKITSKEGTPRNGPLSLHRKFMFILEIKRGKGKVDFVLFLTQHHAMKAYWGVEV